jgi:hypothetical protein
VVHKHILIVQISVHDFEIGHVRDGTSKLSSHCDYTRRWKLVVRKLVTILLEIAVHKLKNHRHAINCVEIVVELQNARPLRFPGQELAA